MASASSQALLIEQFVCGTPRRDRQMQAHLLGTQIWSGLWRSRQMAGALSQARKMDQFVCGTPLLRERLRQAHLLDTWIQSSPWHSRLMVSAFSHQDMGRFVR